MQKSDVRELSERIQKIVRWLIDEREEIDRHNKVELVFECAGSSVFATVVPKDKVKL